MGNFTIEFEENKEINNLETNNKDSVIIEIQANIKKTLKEKFFEFLRKIKIKLCKCCHRNKIQKFMLTPCKHLFHIECLKLWLEKNHGCPVCRNDLPEYNE